MVVLPLFCTFAGFFKLRGMKESKLIVTCLACLALIMMVVIDNEQR